MGKGRAEEEQERGEVGDEVLEEVREWRKLREASLKGNTISLFSFNPHPHPTGPTDTQKTAAYREKKRTHAKGNTVKILQNIYSLKKTYTVSIDLFEETTHSLSIQWYITIGELKSLYSGDLHRVSSGWQKYVLSNCILPKLTVRL